MRRSPRWPSAILALLLVAGSGALGLTAVLATALPAGAATPPACGLLAACPAPAGTVVVRPSTNGEPGPIAIMWTGVASDGHIDQVKATVTWATTGTPVNAPVPAATSATIPSATCSTAAPTAGSQECDVAWPAGVEANNVVLNGQYSFMVQGDTCPNSGLAVFCSSTTTLMPTITVSNPPVAPANVTATLAKAPASGVVVTWDPNPEPDVFGYSVYRVSGSQKVIAYGCAMSFAPAEVRPLARCDAKPSWTDTSSGGGQFTYQVFANRFGASYLLKDQVPSAPGQSKAVTVPGPPAASALVPAKSSGLSGLSNVFASLKPRTGTGFSAPILGPRVNPVPTTTDNGFNPALPYGQQPAPTDPPAIVSAPPPAPKSHSSVGSIALVGAGVLVIVVALHGLWLRSEVRRSGALEALEPEM